MPFDYTGDKAVEVNEVMAQLESSFAVRIGCNLKGLYLHGSLAMGCFRPWSSDIDLLAVVHETIHRAEKFALVDDIMAIAEGGCEFRSIEFSIVTANEAVRAAHPIQYILHYSNHWHQAYKHGMAELVIAGGPDEDLAAHFMVIKHRGIVLLGVPIPDTFGPVACEDYLKAVWYDISNSQQEAGRKPAYTLLNLCRTWMYLETGRVGSKLEGGRWAVCRQEMSSFEPSIQAAVEEYTTGRPGIYDEILLAEAVSFMLGIVKSRIE